jgi:hypothetical protein
VFTHETNRDWKAHARSCTIRTIRFGKPEGLVLSGPMKVRGATGLQRGAPPLAKRRLDSGEV